MILGCSMAPKSSLIFFPPQVTMLIFERGIVSGTPSLALIKFSPIWRLCPSHLEISSRKSFVAWLLMLH